MSIREGEKGPMKARKGYNVRKEPKNSDPIS